MLKEPVSLKSRIGFNLDFHQFIILIYEVIFPVIIITVKIINQNLDLFYITSSMNSRVIFGGVQSNVTKMSPNLIQSDVCLHEDFFFLLHRSGSVCE